MDILPNIITKGNYDNKKIQENTLNVLNGRYGKH